MSKRRILLAEITPTLTGQRALATWSATDRAHATDLSADSLTATGGTTENPDGTCQGVRATLGLTAGQHYWETTVNYAGTADFAIGIAWRDAPINWRLGNEQWPLYHGGESVGVKKNGRVDGPQSAHVDIGAIASGSVIRHWLDMDARTYKIARGAGAWATVLSGESVTDWLYEISGSQPKAIVTAHPAVTLIGRGGNAPSVTANFGATPFVHTPPDGANAGVWDNLPDTPITLYLGSESLRTGAGDTPANTHYEPRLVGELDVERGANCWVWGNQSVSRRGQLEIINADGALDGWADLNWRDASVLLLAGWEGEPRSAFTPWGYALVDQPELAKRSRIILRLLDPLAALDKPLESNLYPPDFANTQAAGAPLPYIIGRPKFIPMTRVDPTPGQRDYGINPPGPTVVTTIYDNGDALISPDASFVPHAAITAANGNFTGWTGTPSVPAGWFSITPYGPRDSFALAAGGGVRCWATQSAVTAMGCLVQLRANTRYRVTFTVASIAKQGTLILRIPGTPDVPVAIATTGAKSLAIDVRDGGQLQFVMHATKGNAPALDCVIRNLRMSAERVTDWTHVTGNPYADVNLSNEPWGRLCADAGTRTSNGVATLLSIATAAGLTLNDLAFEDWAMPGYEHAAYYNEPVTFLTVARRLMDSWCGWVTTSLEGKIITGRVIEPANAPALQLDSTNILQPPEIEADLAKGLTTRLAGARNYSVHTEAEIAGAVPDDLRAQLQAEWGMVVEASAAADERDRIAPEYTHALNADAQPTLLMNRTHMTKEANRIATLWRKKRSFYRVTALLDASAADALEPGQTVCLTWPRWGLHSGKNLLVVSVRTRFFSRRVELTLWG